MKIHFNDIYRFYLFYLLCLFYTNDQLQTNTEKSFIAPNAFKKMLICHYISNFNSTAATFWQKMPYGAHTNSLMIISHLTDAVHFYIQHVSNYIHYVNNI